MLVPWVQWWAACEAICGITGFAAPALLLPKAKLLLPGMHPVPTETQMLIYLTCFGLLKFN